MLKRLIFKDLKRFQLLNKKFLLISIIAVQLFTVSAFSVTVHAQELDANQKAMKIAEAQTQGKAVSSKFVQVEDKKGYKVRILKNGKVSHVFIALEKVQ